jgi:RNA polymerase sigma factor (sigma-70 family)
VTEAPLARSTSVNDALAHPIAGVSGGATATESFEALYRRTAPRVYAYVASLLRDRAAAEDVTAQAFERAFRKRRGFRPSRGSADAWVFGIARNAALDELRRRKRRATLEEERADVAAEDPAGEAERAFDRAAVRAALAGLSGHERDIVALKFAAGLSNAEIAGVLRISESNVGTRLHRTVDKLRRACDELA